MTITFLNENNHIIFKMGAFKNLARHNDRFVVETTNGDSYNIWKNPHIKKIEITP